MIHTVGATTDGQNAASLKMAAEALEKTLADADASVRLGAIRSMSAIGPKTSEAPPAALVAAMNDPEPKNREAVARGLAEYRAGLAGTLESLAAGIDKSSEQKRDTFRTLLESLNSLRCGTKVVPGLIAALGVEDPRIIGLAAARLGDFNANGDVVDWRVRGRSSAVPAIASEAAKPAVPALAATLERLCDKIERGPKTIDPQIAQACDQIRGGLGRLAPATDDQKAATRALTRLLNVIQDSPSPARVAAAKTLGHFNPSPELFATLVGLIDDRDTPVRIAAMWSIDIADFHDGYVIPKELLKAIDYPNAEVRGAAAAAMGHSGMGLDSYIPTILRHARTDADSEVRATCESVLEICCVPPKVTAASIPEIVRAIPTANLRTRRSLGTLLSRLGPAAAEAAPALVESLERVDKEDEAVDPVTRAYERQWIAFSLCKIAPGTPHADRAAAAVARCLSDPNWRPEKSLIEAAARFGHDAAALVPSLQKLEASKDSEIQRAAEAALAVLRKPG